MSARGDQTLSPYRKKEDEEPGTHEPAKDGLKSPCRKVCLEQLHHTEGEHGKEKGHTRGRGTR